MLEPQIVEHGDTWPHCCAKCKDPGSVKNPLLNTWVDLYGAFQPDPNQPATGGPGAPGYGRLYYCKRCYREGARLFGFSAGKKLDELQDASESLAFKDKEISNRDEHIATLTETVTERDRKIKQQQLVIDQFKERDDTWRHWQGILEAHVGGMKKVEAS